LSQKTTDFEAAQGKDFIVLACTILTQYSSVTDGQTDECPGQMNAQAMAKMRKAFCYHA